MSKRLKKYSLACLLIALILAVSALGACKVGSKYALTITVSKRAVIREGDSLDSVKQYLTVTYTDVNGNTDIIEDYVLRGTLKKGKCELTLVYDNVSKKFNVTVLAANDQPPMPESAGLTFSQTDNGYVVQSIGDCADSEVYIPSTYNKQPVVGIADQAFERCETVTSMVIPQSVTTIGYGAFYSCVNLKEVEINGAINEIMASTFWDCSSLERINIPQSVTSIGYYAFRNCSSLKTVTLPNSELVIDNAFVNAGLTELTIPQNVKSIYDAAFNDCVDLEKVYINATNAILNETSYDSYGWHAFNGCSKLTTVVVAANVQSFLFSTFINCDSLSSIDVAADNQYYSSQNGVLYDKAKTQILFVPKDLSGVVVIPDTVTEVKRRAFYERTKITTLTVGTGVANMGEEAFFYCNGLTTVYWNAINCEIPYYGYTSNTVFADTNIKTVVIGNKVEVIPCLFYGCSTLENVTIGSGVKEIYSGAFCDCNIKSLRYNGKRGEWKTTKIYSEWINSPYCDKIICTNGESDLYW